jgi:hypothetical protein
LADSDVLDPKTEIIKSKDCIPDASPSEPNKGAYVDVVPSRDNSQPPKTGQKRRQDTHAATGPETSTISKGQNTRRSRSRQPNHKHSKSAASAAGAHIDPPADPSAFNHTNQIIRDLLEKKGHQIIADHQADRLADLNEETRSADASAAGAVDSAGRNLPTDDEVLLYFANITSAFNKGSISEMRSAIERALALNAVLRAHVICLPGSDNPHFTDKVIPGKGPDYRGFVTRS